MKKRYLKIINGQILTPQGWLKEGTLIIENSQILEITPTNVEIPEVEVIDAGGLYITPGCIDMHVHGGGGYDFTQGTPEAFTQIAKAHAAHGMTSIFPTLEATSLEKMKLAIRTCEQSMEKPSEGASIQGLHLEGNYLNMQMKGGQNPIYITDPNPEEYQELIASTECIKRWTASPELKGALTFGKYASQKGILVSLGHTTSNYALIKTAYRSGYTHATHFYNAMTGVHRQGEFKQEGTIESIYLIDPITVEIVADGIHVPPAILKLVHKIKGVERTALVTDAMSAAAYPKFTDPSKRVIIEDGVCKLADRSAIAGSIATADRLIRTMTQEAEISLADTIRMASETPARIMKIFDKKGSLEKGKDADIIIFDTNITIKTTVVEGQVVYRKA